jgi:8-oxo-dGTP pyrophosphatase MutT (NUDIX family)
VEGWSVNSQIAAAVRAYLGRRPAESATLAPLLDLADGPAAVASRVTLPGHVTCGALLVNADGRVLQIYHRRLERWLLPGGHVEPGDATPLAAAVRELAEETGVDVTRVVPLGSDPIDIDAHRIPASPAKGEPEHVHYSFCFPMRIPEHGEAVALSLQLDEVTDSRWVTVGELDEDLADKAANFLTGRGGRWGHA